MLSFNSHVDSNHILKAVHAMLSFASLENNAHGHSVLSGDDLWECRSGFVVWSSRSF